MKTSFLKLLALAVSVGVGGLMAQQSPERPERPSGAENRGPTKIRVPKGVELPTAVQELVAQFQAQRSTLMESRRALQATLQGLSEEERKAAIQAARSASEEVNRAQRDLARQVRKELLDLRKARRSDTGG